MMKQDEEIRVVESESYTRDLNREWKKLAAHLSKNHLVEASFVP